MIELDTVLGALREEYEPDAEAKSRVRSALVASLVMTGTATTATTVVGGTATGGTAVSANTIGQAAGAATTAKTAAGGAVAWFTLLVGTGTVAAIAAVTALQSSTLPEASTTGAHADIPVVAQHTEAPPASPLAETAQAPASDAAPRSAEVPSVELVVEAPRVATPSALPKRARSASAPVRAEEKVAPPVPDVSQPSTLMAELRLIRGASQSLRSGQSADAARLLEEHRQRFPKGVLAHERRGLSILVQCSSGGVAVRPQAEAFVQANPKSPLAQSISTRCLK